MVGKREMADFSQPFSRDMRLRSSAALELEVAVRRDIERAVVDDAGHARRRIGAAEAADGLTCAEALGGPKAECVAWRLVAAGSGARSNLR